MVKKTKAEKQAEADLDWLTADARGRRILWRLFSASTLLGGAVSLEHAALAFREGQRALMAPYLAALVSVSPDRFHALLTENQQDCPARAGRDDSPDGDGPDDDGAAR